MSGARYLVVALACAGLAQGCAWNRADVKSLRDPAAGRVQFDAVLDTTIAALNAVAPQCGPAGNRRVRDEEFRVYRVTGIMTRVRRERDHDVHIVIADPANPRQHMVVEADDPDFKKNTTSPYRDRLAAGRGGIDALIAGVARLDQLHGITVRVTGVGFFDINHLQKGRSRSCLELHPILAIERSDEHPRPRPAL
jgi:hypothetical protein